MKRFSKKYLAIICGAMITIVGCGGNTDAPAEDASGADNSEVVSASEDVPVNEDAAEEETAVEEETETPVEETEETAVEEETAEAAEESSEISELPAYEYPDKGSTSYGICKYLVEEVSKDYDEAKVCIPYFIEIATDNSNPDDILIYGDYWIDNYNLEGDTLVTESGGNYPGLMHLKKTDDGYEVTAFDVVEDGEDGMASAKEIFGDYYDKYLETMEDSESRDNTRVEFMSEYVLANELPITQYQDYGWDPVPLSGD